MNLYEAHPYVKLLIDYACRTHFKLLKSRRGFTGLILLLSPEKIKKKSLRRVLHRM